MYFCAESGCDIDEQSSITFDMKKIIKFNGLIAFYYILLMYVDENRFYHDNLEIHEIQSHLFNIDPLIYAHHLSK